MDEQIFTWPLSADETSGIENLKAFLFDQQLMRTDKRIQQSSYGDRLGALTQIYLELNLPLQVALRAAEADLCQHDVQKSVSY